MAKAGLLNEPLKPMYHPLPPVSRRKERRDEKSKTMVFNLRERM